MAEDFDSKVFRSILRLAERSAQYPKPKPLAEDEIVPVGFRALGIGEFFICPYDAGKDNFAKPFPQLMALPGDRRIRDYIEGFQEAGSTLSKAREAFLETILLERILAEVRRGQCVFAYDILTDGLRETLRSVRQEGLLKEANGDLVPTLVHGLGDELKRVMKEDVLTMQQDRCSCLLPAADIESFTPFRVVGLDERAAAVIWQAFVLALRRLTGDFASLPERPPAEFNAAFEGRLGGQNSFWENHGEEVDWGGAFNVLVGRMPDALRSCAGAKANSVVRRPPTNQEGVVQRLYATMVKWARYERKIHDMEGFKECVIDINARIESELPARAFAVRATGWPRLLILPVIVERRLAGVFFADLRDDSTKLHAPDKSRKLRALVNSLVGPSLSAYGAEVQRERAEAKLRVEKAERERAEDAAHKWRKFAAAFQHHIGNPLHGLEFIKMALEDAQRNPQLTIRERASELRLLLDGLSSAASIIRTLEALVKKEAKAEPMTLADVFEGAMRSYRLNYWQTKGIVQAISRALVPVRLCIEPADFRPWGIPTMVQFCATELLINAARYNLEQSGRTDAGEYMHSTLGGWPPYWGAKARKPTLFLEALLGFDGDISWDDREGVLGKDERLMLEAALRELASRRISTAKSNSRCCRHADASGERAVLRCVVMTANGIPGYRFELGGNKVESGAIPFFVEVNFRGDVCERTTKLVRERGWDVDISQYYELEVAAPRPVDSRIVAPCDARTTSEISGLAQILDRNCADLRTRGIGIFSLNFCLQNFCNEHFSSSSLFLCNENGTYQTQPLGDAYKRVSTSCIFPKNPQQWGLSD